MSRRLAPAVSAGLAGLISLSPLADGDVDVSRVAGDPPWLTAAVAGADADEPPRSTTGGDASAGNRAADGPTAGQPPALDDSLAVGAVDTARPAVAEDAFGRPVAEEHVPPDWVGTLPIGEPNPVSRLHNPRPELAVRQFATMSAPLPPPPTDEQFFFTNEPLSDEVVARSTWHEGCPVTREQLRHLTVSHWGFEGNVHTGELLVHAQYATGIVEVFRVAFEHEFPIESLQIVSREVIEEEHSRSLRAGEPIGGDGNGSGAYACRNSVGAGRWSQHAYGLAIDLNPFQNPYLKIYDDPERDPRLIPPMAGHYLDRDWVRPGMLTPGHPVVEAFAAIGWEWGGDWSSAKDWMHFSHNGY